MIYTLTMNAAIDLNLTCLQVESEKVNRVSKSNYSPNGKAINVSIVLNHFGIESVAMGVFGGFTGKHIVECLDDKGINVWPFYIDGSTRINVFVNDDKEEYKFVSKGSEVPQKVQQDILQAIAAATDIKYLVMSGSLPPGVEPEYLDQIMTTCQANNVKVILDLSDQHLSSLLAYKPLLIKPNDEELMSVFNLRSSNREEAIDSIHTLHTLGVENILLTLGSKGMYFSNGESIYFCNAPEVDLHSSACAGDSSLASFLSIWLNDQKNIEEALKLASAVGADVASSAGIGELNHYPQLLNLIFPEKIC